MITVNKKIIIRPKVVKQLPGIEDDVYLPRIGGAFIPNRPPLNNEEMAKYLPHIVNSNPSDIEWYGKCKRYFEDISVRVHKEGLTLNIGMTYNNEEDKNNKKNGVPVNLEDYILYRHCKVLGTVANDKDSSNKSPKILFWMEDPDELTKAKATKADDISKAIVMLSESMNNAVKVKYVVSVALDLLKGVWATDPLKPLAELTSDDLRINLFDLAQKHPKTIIKLLKDPSLEYKSFITKAIDMGLIVRLPHTNVLVYKEGSIDIEMGKSLNESVIFLKQEKNLNIFNTLKSRTQFEFVLAAKKQQEKTPPSK